MGMGCRLGRSRGVLFGHVVSFGLCEVLGLIGFSNSTWALSFVYGLVEERSTACVNLVRLPNESFSDVMMVPGMAAVESEKEGRDEEEEEDIDVVIFPVPCIA